MVGERRKRVVSSATATIVEQLPRALAEVGRPGDFAVGGRRVTPMPTLHVARVGIIAFPLMPAQAQALIAVAERAPYGRGSETLVDTGVRRSWQIAPAALAKAPLERQRIWRQTLARIVRRATTDLGVEGKVRAELYKVLVYEPGDFFVAHRDTEKVDGMFATLVVSLPSVHEGGALVVRHAGETRRFELRVEAPSRVAWSAFYADCVHELEPVTSGYRLALVYNLAWEERAATSRGEGSGDNAPPDQSQAVTSVATLLRAWAAGPAPTRLISVLQHHYTTANLSFTQLKNPDAAAAAVLLSAAREVDCVCHLAMVSIFESGAAEPVDYDPRGRRRGDRSHRDDDNDAYEVIEVDIRRQRIEGLIAAPGEVSFAAATSGTVDPRAGMSFELDEVSPPGAIDREAPDDQHFTEATGNEGGSFERTYRRAAIVVWPRARELTVLAQADHAVSLARLRELIDAGDGRATQLASAMISAWSAVAASALERAPRSNRHDWGLSTGAMLEALGQLRDAPLLATFVSAALEPGGLHARDCDALLAAAAATGWGPALPWLVRLADHAMARAMNVNGAVTLIEGLASRLGEAEVVRPIAEAVGWAACDALTGDERAPLQRDLEMHVEPEVLARLVRAFAGISPALASHSINELLGALSDGDTIVAIALALGVTAGTPLAALTMAALQYLQARCALALEWPSTWVRDHAAVRCKCKDCQAAKLFLADARQETWRLKAVERARGHVEQELRRAMADVGFLTVRGSSPLTLVCTKNQASYLRRVAQREGDLRSLSRLAACSSSPKEV